MPDHDDLAFNENDMDRVEQSVAEDVTHTIRGHAAVSGTYRGRRAMGDVLRRIKDLRRGRSRPNPR